jgi:membrane dipeptidase
MTFRVFDAHVDTLLALGEGEDILSSCPGAQLDVPRAREAGVTDLVTAVCAEACRDMAGSFRTGLARFREAAPRSQIRLLLMLEGCQPLLEGLDRQEIIGLLDFASLTWNGENSLGGGIGCSTGLKPEGFALARELSSAGVVLDASHLSDASREDLLVEGFRGSSATHCNCRALCNVPRNLPDADLRRIAELDGVIGITMVPDFLGDDATLDTVADHLEHAASIAGILHVGFGSDLDGTSTLPAGITDCGFWPRLFELLSLRGWADTDLSAVAGDNWRRVLDSAKREGS